MPTLQEGALTFDFPSHWKASKYDEWTYYRKHFGKIVSQTKAIDILAIDPGHTAWLIEIKDYSQNRRVKPLSLADEVAKKVKDSLAGIAGAAFNANNSNEQSMAQEMFECAHIRVVLHLEQPKKHSRLRPRAIEPASVQMKLKQLVHSVDPHPKVVERRQMQNMQWSVS